MSETLVTRGTNHAACQVRGRLISPRAAS